MCIKGNIIHQSLIQKSISKLILFALPFFLFMLSVGLMGQSNVKFQKLGIENGLSQNSINCIFQDSSGFMWFGTEDGLNKYDGYEFKVYRNDPQNKNSLSHNFVYSICEDKTGAIWIGTYGGGLNCLNPKTGTFKHFLYQEGVGNSLCNDKIYVMIQSSDGNIWIGTDKGLCRFDPQTERFVRLKPKIFSKSIILCLLEDEGDKLWIGTSKQGLFQYDRQNGKIKSFPIKATEKAALSNQSVWSIKKDKSGQLWLGTRLGLNRYDPKKEIFYKYFKNHKHQNGLGHNSIYCMYFDKQSTLWLGTWGGGIDVMDTRDNKFTHLQHNPLMPDSISNNYISCIFEDRSGLIWVGTYGGGINKYNPRTRIFKHFFHHPQNKNSLSDNIVYSLLQDKSGIIWIGTHGGGLNKLNLLTKKFKVFKHNPNNPNSLSHNEVWSIIQDSNGYLWIGTRGGLNRFEPQTETFKVFKKDKNLKQSLQGDFISSILEDHKGTIWLGIFGNGLNKLNRKQDSFSYLSSDKSQAGLNNRFVYTLLEDNQNHIWIGTYGGGINVYNPQNGSMKYFIHDPLQPNSLNCNEILCFHHDPKGVIWIGTLGGGLNKYLPESESFEHFRERDGLANGVVNGILEDSKGNLWLSTYKGLSRFNPVTKEVKNFDIHDGIQSNEFNKGAFFKNREGMLFFGGLKGFNIFDPGKIETNMYVPPIFITNFTKYNKKVNLIQHISIAKELILSYKDKFFGFDFVALDYTVGSRNKYAYKMQGFNDDWITTNADKRFADFTNLDPGSYVFRVKGSNSDGIWNEEGTSLKIVIVPPFWQEWWFTIILLISFSVISYLVIGFIRKYISFSTFWKKHKYVGKFKLIEKLGSGGMGTVFKAKNMIDQAEIVAIKVLREELFADESNQKRFKQEASIIDQLDHPNIVKIVERGQHKQKLFIAMELLEGISLHEKLKNESRIDLHTALPIMIQVTDALAKIHGKNIIHRDLKPANIMLVSVNNNPNFVKLLDFGLAQMQNQTRLTETGVVVGTLNYLSPEQISSSHFTPASDIYALGVVFYEMTTGIKPFPGESATELMNVILNKEPIQPSTYCAEMPDLLEKLILQMLEKKEELRPSIGEVLHKLSMIQSTLKL